MSNDFHSYEHEKSYLSQTYTNLTHMNILVLNMHCTCIVSVVEMNSFEFQSQIITIIYELCIFCIRPLSPKILKSALKSTIFNIHVPNFNIRVSNFNILLPNFNIFVSNFIFYTSCKFL